MFPILFSLGPISLQTYSLFVFVAFVLGSFVFWKRSKDEYYDEIDIFDLSLGCVFWGLIGGRLVYILLHFSDYGLNLLYWLSFWSKPGIHWLGMYVCALIYFVRFVSGTKWNYFKTLDLAVIGLALAHVILSLGLLIGGDGGGKLTNLPWGMVFPGSYEPRHPVGLYTAILWLLVFTFLWWVEGHYRRFVWYQRFKGDSKPGFLFFCYLIFMGIIGLVTVLVSEAEYVYWGINLDLVLYISLLVGGVLGIITRSGMGAKFGIDEWFSKKSIKKS